MTIIQDQHTKKFRQSLIENVEFLNAIEGLKNLNVDLDTAYEWVCNQCGIHSFVADDFAWDMFFKTFVSTTNS